jgi:hypothetical protein
MRPLAPHMWLLLVQVDVGSGTVVVGVLTVSVGSEGAGAVLGAGAVSASGVGWLASSWWYLRDRDIIGITEVASSRVSNVGVTTLVEVTVGRGGRVLPEASTVRMAVLLMVGPGGVTVTTRVVGVWVLVLDSLVDAVPMFLMISASSETPALTDWLVELVELLEDEIEVFNVVLAVVLRVVVSTAEVWGPPCMKKLGEMLIGWALQSQPATTGPAPLMWTSLDDMLLTRPITV